MSIGLLLFFLFVLVSNVAIGYIIAILLGLGPPDFRTAWTRIKLSVASPLPQSGSGFSRLSQMIDVVGFMALFVGRFKKHVPPASSETELPDEQPSETPHAESTATLPPSPTLPPPATTSPTTPAQESSNNIPGKPEQPNPPA